MESAPQAVADLCADLPGVGPGGLWPFELREPRFGQSPAAGADGSR